MGENSKIEWCDHTFNPWIGCTKVSAACDNCYAEAWDRRFHGDRWGPHASRTRTSPANWRKPLTWNAEARAAGRRARVFCASLADVFDNHKSIAPEWRESLWRLIKETPHLDWLLLTKRPQNIARFLPSDWGDGYANVWLGTTVENQEEAERRNPHLLAVPAVIHFLSCEPLVGALDIAAWLTLQDMEVHIHGQTRALNVADQKIINSFGRSLAKKKGMGLVDWVITGGESGRNWRPADTDWYRALRDQCLAANVPFLFKQWGGPTRRDITAKGRVLDGAIWNEFPTPPAASVARKDREVSHASD